jgi:hypothetical protein
VLCIAKSQTEKRLLCSANAAQQFHNRELVLFDGRFEGRLAVAAGRRASSQHENNATQNQKQILNINAHLSFAFTSAFAAISSSHASM